MKRSSKIAVSVVAALGLGLAVAAVSAEPGHMGNVSGEKGMQHRMGGMGHGPAGQGAGHAPMTPEEHTALREKMRNATTPEERHKLAEATHTEMQKRAKEKGITLPEGHGHRFGAVPQAPATTEHAH